MWRTRRRPPTRYTRGNRGAGQGIADQYLDESSRTGLRVLLGGGRRWFLPQKDAAGANVFGSSRGSSNDYAALPADLQTAWGVPAGAIDPNRDLISDFEGAGFKYVDSATSLEGAFGGGPTPRKLLGLFGYGNMNVAADKLAKRRGEPTPAGSYVVDDYYAPDQPMLDDMTEAALKVLGRGEAGFVLMVEGAHIDKQSHLMDPDRAIGEVIEFDNAVAVARRFARRRGDTLVLVLADHECSGFSLIGALTGGISNLQSLTPDNGVLDPALQPGRQKVVGLYEGAGFPRYTLDASGYPLTYDVDGKLLVGFGGSAARYESWLSKPLPVIDSLLSNDIKTELDGKTYVREPYLRPESGFGFFLRGQAAGRTNAVHTAADIPVSAYTRGDGWREFVGVQTNTDVFFKIARLVLGGGSPRWLDERERGDR